jgi:hypothetical protein
MSIQSDLQTSLRAATGTAGHYNEDWHAFLDAQSIPAGQLGERILAYGQTLDASLSDVASAMLYFMREGVALAWSPPSLLLEDSSYLLLEDGSKLLLEA